MQLTKKKQAIISKYKTDREINILHRIPIDSIEFDFEEIKDDASGFICYNNGYLYETNTFFLHYCKANFPTKFCITRELIGVYKKLKKDILVIDENTFAIELENNTTALNIEKVKSKKHYVWSFIDIGGFLDSYRYYWEFDTLVRFQNPKIVKETLASLLKNKKVKTAVTLNLKKQKAQIIHDNNVVESYDITVEKNLLDINDIKERGTMFMPMEKWYQGTEEYDIIVKGRFMEYAVQ
jgi:hypothetical protein